MLRAVESHSEYGTTVFDFMFEIEDDDSQLGRLSPDFLFLIFMDSQYPNRDILIKPYNGDPTEDYFLCVALDIGAVDICRRVDFPPSRFVLNIPAS